jgi:hypothetical protein
MTALTPDMIAPAPWHLKGQGYQIRRKTLPL